MDKRHEYSRKQFEVAAANKLNFSISTVIANRNGESYDSDILSVWWYFWQASRASIVVEFIEPPFYAVKKDSTPIENIMVGAKLAIEQIRRSIGLSIKGE